MRRRRRNKDLPLTVDVNVTSLVDVAFTLLVIFIITAPALQGGVDVNLPDARGDPLDTADPLIVSVTAEGRVFVGATPIPLEGLEQSMATFFAGGRQGIVKADERTPTGMTVRVLMAIEAGGGRPAVATEPPPPRVATPPARR